MRRGLGIAALLVLAVSAPARAQGDAATCPRDLLVAQSMQRQALDQLDQTEGDEAKSCRIWRRHVETMRRVAGVYGRCLSGAERTERIAQVQASDREFSEAIRSRCKGS